MKRLALTSLLLFLAAFSFADTRFDYTEEVNSDVLKHEIETSTITVALDRVDVPAPGNVSIHFKADLSAGEETTLDAIVAAHDPTVLTKNDPTVVRVVEEVDGETGGHYGISTMVIDLDNDTSDTLGWYVVEKSFPYPVTIIGGQCRVRPEQMRDLSRFVIAPGTIVGALTANAVATDILSVSQTVIDNVFIGAEITLDDSPGDPSDNEVLGRVVSVDAVGLTITVETANVETFSASSPTYVKMSGVMADIELFESDVQMGFDRIGARTPLPAGTVIRMEYKKLGNATGLVGAYISYLY